jgi:spore coat protein U-like protein
MTMKKQILSLAAGAALVFAAQNSFAGSVPAGSVDYSVTLNGGCTVVTPAAGPIALDGGAGLNVPYTNLAAVSAGSVTVNCSNTLAYGVCVDGGLYANLVTRHLDGQLPDLTPGTDQLVYDLKVAGISVGDLGCTGVEATYVETAAWTNPVGGLVPGLTGNALDQTYDLTADVIIPPASLPGTYTDTVALTVVW